MANHLAGETSPYLLQHQANPVNWRPWGAEALAAARADDKPILLSIGYAACHWCHVMAHESFEDEAIAALMNQLFVSIKVDREERPDIDLIYQNALALLGQQGGWPLTMFLKPTGEPFWGGTYFPPTPRWGRPSFTDVLRTVSEIYRSEPDKVDGNVAALGSALARLARPLAGELVGQAVLDQAAERLLGELDPINGGIGEAPKFPQMPIFELLWRTYKRTRKEAYRVAVDLTLSAMAQGGIYDHLGGGFARYAVDERWLVPHFEKMLYDNAQIIDLMTLVWQETQNPLYGARVAETIDWTLREMIAEGGGFASSLDADSEGEEGKFYVWTKDEIDTVLGADAGPFDAAYDVTGEGNWEGRVILNRSHDPALKRAAQEGALAAARARLFAVRSRRPRPGWDDKVLADWNGMMIAAMARAAAVFDKPAWAEAAMGAFAFVRDTMGDSGRLRHSARGRRAHTPGTLDDYAHMARAALALYETRGEPRYLENAREWARMAVRHHGDADVGGFFLTADDTDALIVRIKSAGDHATPSGNGTMVEVLARLYLLTGEENYRIAAQATITAFSGELARGYFSLASLLNGAETLEQALQVVLVGRAGSADLGALLTAVRRRSHPSMVLQVVEPGAVLPRQHPAAGKTMAGERALAYVCRGATCSLPIHDPAGLAKALG